MASSARIDELRKKFEENPRRYFAPLANEYRKSGDVEQAISICREYLPQQPGHMSGHIVYGQALYEARQFEEAKTVFETALSLDPENLIALRHLGDIALIVADTEGARSWYRRVLEADPRNEEIQAQLATLDLAAAQTTAESLGTSSPTPALGVPATEPTPSAVPVSSSAPTVVVDAIPSPTPAEGVVMYPFSEAPPPLPAPAASGVSHHDSASTTRDPSSESRFAPPPTPATPVADARSSEGAATAGGEAPSRIELESYGAGDAAAADAPPAAGYTAGYSLAGLQSTSLESSEPTAPAQSLSSVPTLELDLASEVPGAPKVPPPASVPDIPAPVGTATAAESQEPPPIPQESRSAATAEPPPIPSTSASVATAEPPIPAQPPSEVTGAAAVSAAQRSAPELVELDKAPTGALPDVPVQTPSPFPDLEIGEPGAPEDPASAPDSGPFVTETMAELYLRQGHRDEALRVYRALLDQRPGDPSLTAKVASLQSPPPSAASMANQKGDEAASLRLQPTMRDVLGAIALRRPGSRPAPRPLRLNAVVTAPAPQTAPPVAASTAPAPASVPTSRPEPPVASSVSTPASAPSSLSTDAISRLFGNAQISSADEGAARSLALAFAETNGADGVPRGGADIGGSPARVASDELSLDAVFGTGEAAQAAAPSSFSFDQFFSTRAATQPSSGAVPPGSAGTASPEEVAHFTKWLEGLKQR